MDGHEFEGAVSLPSSVTSAVSVSGLVQESLVSEEVVHDLDSCEVTVEGEELNPEQESLEVDMARLQQKGIEVSSSHLGMTFTGERLQLVSGGPDPVSPLPLRGWDKKFNHC